MNDLHQTHATLNDGRRCHVVFTVIYNWKCRVVVQLHFKPRLPGKRDVHRQIDTDVGFVQYIRRCIIFNSKGVYELLLDH